MDTGADLVGSADGLGNGRAVEPGKVSARNRKSPDNGSGNNRTEVAVSDADDAGRVEVADGPKRTAKWEPSDSVFLRLARAQDDVKTITQDATIKVKAKEGGGEFSYKGVSSPQVITFAKRALLDNGVVFIPVAAQDGVRISGNKTALWVEGQFVSVDNPTDRIAVGAWGAGTDNNDKDYAKAMTNAVKIILSKVLMMSTLEDEHDEATPHDADAKPRAVKNAEALTDVAIKTWADAYKRALDGAKTLKELASIRAENKHMMSNPGLPEVTRDYFIEKITALEGMLE
jgi:hypothetical protein